MPSGGGGARLCRTVWRSVLQNNRHLTYAASPDRGEHRQAAGAIAEAITITDDGRRDGAHPCTRLSCFARAVRLRAAELRYPLSTTRTPPNGASDDKYGTMRRSGLMEVVVPPGTPIAKKINSAVNELAARLIPAA